MKLSCVTIMNLIFLGEISLPIIAGTIDSLYEIPTPGRVGLWASAIIAFCWLFALSTASGPFMEGAGEEIRNSREGNDDSRND